MNRFYHNFYILFAPLIRFLFPVRVIGAENVPEGAALL